MAKWYCEHQGIHESPPHCAVSVGASGDAAAAALRSPTIAADDARPKIVTLCGSTRFHDAFQEANFRLTMAGNIVLSVGFYPHTKSAHEYLEHGEHVGITENEKERLDDLHKRKIDLSDEVFVLNVGGYIGDSTRSEIAHAEKRGIPVRYLEAALSTPSPTIAAPSPSNEPAVEWVMCAVRDAMREHNFVVERGSDLWNRLRRHIEAALNGWHDGAGQ